MDKEERNSQLVPDDAGVHPLRGCEPDQANGETADKSLAASDKRDNSSTGKRMLELKELLDDVTKLESTMLETKQGYEALYKNLRLSLHQKLKTVNNMEREIQWLMSECSSLERSCKDISKQRDNREGEIKKWLGNVMDIDLKTSVDLPNIYSKYIELTSAEECKKLLEEVENTRISLNKFEHMIKTKQQRMKRGDNSIARNRSSQADAFLKCMLDKLTSELGIQTESTSRTSAQSNTENTTVTQQSATLPEPSITSAQTSVTSAQTTVTSPQPNNITDQQLLMTSAASADQPTPSAVNDRTNSPRTLDQWFRFQEGLDTIIPPPSLLNDMLTAEDFMPEEPQISDTDLLPDDFGMIL